MSTVLKTNHFRTFLPARIKMSSNAEIPPTASPENWFVIMYTTVVKMIDLMK